jgi:hypothetical protein
MIPACVEGLREATKSFGQDSCSGPPEIYIHHHIQKYFIRHCGAGVGLSSEMEQLRCGSDNPGVKARNMLSLLPHLLCFIHGCKCDICLACVLFQLWKLFLLKLNCVCYLHWCVWVTNSFRKLILKCLES